MNTTTFLTPAEMAELVIVGGRRPGPIEIEAAWAETPEDLQALRYEQGTTLAGAVRALALRAKGQS